MEYKDDDGKTNICISALWIFLTGLSVGLGAMLFINSVYDFETMDDNYLEKSAKFSITYKNERYCTKKMEISSKKNIIKFEDAFGYVHTFPKNEAVIERGCE